MVVRAADQVQWDVGEPRHYGSAAAAAVRGSTAGGTDDERPAPPGLHHFTARVYPPAADYCVCGGGHHQLYCRGTVCGCDAYAAATDYAAAGSTASRRRVHDRDCATLRAVTAAVGGGGGGGGDPTSPYGRGAPLKRRRLAANDATAAETSPGRRTDAQETAACGRPDGVARSGGHANALYDQPADGGTTSPQPSASTTMTAATSAVPELVTDCSLGTMTSSSNHHHVRGSTASRPPLYGMHSSS